MVRPVLLWIELNGTGRPGIFGTVKEKQRYCISILRKDAEIDAVTPHGSTKGKTVAGFYVNHGIHLQ